MAIGSSEIRRCPMPIDSSAPTAAGFIVHDFLPFATHVMCPEFLSSGFEKYSKAETSVSHSLNS